MYHIVPYAKMAAIALYCLINVLKHQRLNEITSSVIWSLIVVVVVVAVVFFFVKHQDCE